MICLFWLIHLLSCGRSIKCTKIWFLNDNFFSVYFAYFQWNRTVMHDSDLVYKCVQVMAWCRPATSHCVSQCWHRSMYPYGVTRPQWVKWRLTYYMYIHIFKSSHDHRSVSESTLTNMKNQITSIRCIPVFLVCVSMVTVYLSTTAVYHKTLSGQLLNPTDNIMNDGSDTLNGGDVSQRYQEGGNVRAIQ